MIARGFAIVALTLLFYVTYTLLTGAAYVARLYGGLGDDLVVALGMLWVIVAGVTVPLAAWGLAASGGVRWTGAGKIAAGVGVLLLCGGVWGASHRAAGEALLDADSDAIAEVLTGAVPVLEAGSISLATFEPAACAEAPGPGVATVVVTYVREGAPSTRCVQAPTLADAAGDLTELLSRDAAAGPVKVDVITARQPLAPFGPVVDRLALRPGLDGVCSAGRCLMPWQLNALSAFVAVSPISVVREIRIGIDPAQLWSALGNEVRQTVAGLTRVETASFVTADGGALVGLHRLREDGPELTPNSLQTALRASEHYIVAAQQPDGRFAYNLDPFTGVVSNRSFSVARQAGTTLVLCELAQERSRARAVATRALAMLTAAAAQAGDLAMVHDPRDDGESVDFRYFDLGDSALAAIAFLSCRDLVGERFDTEIDGLTRFLLAMQRPDGSFYAEFDLADAAPIPGPDPLFAVGQAVFALSLLERLTVTLPERFAPTDRVRSAVEAAMDYTAHRYWDPFAADFFYLEENWHCMAARASLPHHRHDGYERFCTDYVRFKTRLVLTEDDGVAPDFVGGYSVGNVLTPYSSGSATFGEAASAALAILAARGESSPLIEERLRLALAFLVHFQWTETSCFACSPDRVVAGGFSEHPASPHIRIDYVQHAMGALGHGGRMLGLVEGR